MEAVRIETEVQADGTITVNNLPFSTGEKVEVIVLSALTPKAAQERQDAAEANKYPLRGMPIVYHDPFEPAVPESDWEVYQ